MLTNLAKIFIPAAISFIIGIILAVPVAKFLYKNEMWKKKAKEVAFDGSATPIFNKMHAERETNVPRMGGVIIWGSVIITTIIIFLADLVTDFKFLDKLDFLSRDQTWIPLLALVIGALVGLIDDYREVKGGSYKVGGLSLRKRLIVVALVSL